MRMFPVRFSSQFARSSLVLVALACAGLLAFAYILEFFVNLVPCPLCIVQRFFFLLVGLVALFGGLRLLGWFTVGRSALLIGLFSLAGGSVALRQVWLQHFPPESDPTRCTVSFGSFLDSVILALGGAGNCAIVDWTFLGLSIAEWSLLWFAAFLFYAIWLALASQSEDRAV